MNPLHNNLKNGTFGEIYVQLRLLLYNVQAAPPIKDTENDLIAVFDDHFKAVQVKTVNSFPVKISIKNLPDKYHILAIVVIDQSTENPSSIKMDKCSFYLLEKSEVTKGYFSKNELNDNFIATEGRILSLFCS